MLTDIPNGKLHCTARKTCPQCGLVYTCTGGHQTFCSYTCQQAAARGISRRAMKDYVKQLEQKRAKRQQNREERRQLKEELSQQAVA